MAFIKCPSCGGSDLHRSALMSLFASTSDIQGLSGPEWERMTDGVSSRPIGLGEP